MTDVSLTHTGSDHLTNAEIAGEFKKIKERLTNEFSNDPEKLSSLLALLTELSTFELGRFLIQNKSLSGYWTWYVINDYKNHAINSPLEKFFVEKVPVVIATQDRFAIFQSLLKKYIKSNNIVCSIPCGMMADLLTLNLAPTITNVRFIGIDLDDNVFSLATVLATKLNIPQQYEFQQKNAWELNVKNVFDIITSNGLNIYEKDDNRVVALYRNMHSALKEQGYLICSALTPPSEWEMGQINQQDLATAATLMKTVLNTSWANFRESEKTRAQLRDAGFNNIEIVWDKQKMFPTFLAQR